MNGLDRPRGEIRTDGLAYWDDPAWGWQPFWLTAAEVAVAARQRYAVRAHDVRFLASGALNQSWSLDDAWVLRVSRPERDAAALAYEHRVTRALRADVSTVVTAEPGLDGTTVQSYYDRKLSLFPFVHGVSGETLEPMRRAVLAAETLACLHRAALSRPQLGQRPGSASYADRPPHPWAKVRPVLTTGRTLDPELRAAVAAIDAGATRLADWHAALGRPTQAVIHGDLNSRNLIICNNLVAGVIDWDNCRLDPLAAEIGEAVMAAPDPAVTWRTYLDAGGPLDADDFGLFAGFAMRGALSELQWAVNKGQPSPTAPDLLRTVAASIHDLAREAERLGLTW